jgi:plasmid stability protein
VTVKNITVTVPDNVYRNARIRAAERGTSVSALVAGYLRSLSGRQAEFSRLEAQQKQIQSPWGVRSRLVTAGHPLPAGPLGSRPP